MARITSLIILLVLAVAAASIPAPADAAGASGAALKSTTRFLFKWMKRIKKGHDIYEFINENTDGEQLPRGNDAAAGLVPMSMPDGVAVDVVMAGGVSFSVAGVDVTSRVTWTSRCGDDQQVACGDPLCEQYGACDGGGDASAAAGRVCNSVAPAGVPLHEGNIVLLGAKGNRFFISPKDNAAYACRPNAAAGGSDYAVIGLGRGNNILANVTAEAQLFSYIIDGDLQGSTVWLRHNALLPQRATAARAGSRSTTRLLGSNNSSIYYVNITGIKVGGGEVASEEEAAVGILMTTMPFTFLKPSLFDHLKQELKAVASPVNGSGIDARLRQLCYPNGTELPAMTLVFVGQNAGMDLQPEHYSYKKSNGVVCLSILPSPWSSGESVIGSMVQAGRRMTYNLKDYTLTFDTAVSASSSEPSPSTSSSVAQAVLTPFFLSPAIAVLLLLAIIM